LASLQYTRNLQSLKQIEIESVISGIMLKLVDKLLGIHPTGMCDTIFFIYIFILYKFIRKPHTGHLVPLGESSIYYDLL